MKKKKLIESYMDTEHNNKLLKQKKNPPQSMKRTHSHKINCYFFDYLLKAFHTGKEFHVLSDKLWEHVTFAYLLSPIKWDQNQKTYTNARTGVSCYSSLIDN